MKKILKYLLCLMMAITVAGCSSSTTVEDSSSTVKILCPTGAPALAFVDSYSDIIAEGSIDFVDGSDQLSAELAKDDSEYDIIVAPINVGATLMSKDSTSYKLKAVITWGNLYLVGTSEDALDGDGEIALFGEGAVPQKIYETVNIDTSLTPTYYQSGTLVQEQLLAGNVEVGLLAEPLATATIAKASQAGITLSIIKDLQEEYGGGYPQAAIFMKDGTNYDSLFEAIDEFTNGDYADLEADLEEIGVDTLGLPSVEIVVKSIERQNVHYTEASECIDEITEFLKLYDIEFSEDMLVS
ncbi:MAG: hypothetical protein LUF02_10560 [Erysipelotrichaceae bacterium]|nr:hypothetical protein [Erysipelotrichaceae bacterium]